MKNLNLSFKTLAMSAGGLLLLTFGSFFAHHNTNMKAQKMMTLNSGVGTCFTRVNQSFTSLMIQDFSSGYLQQDFMSGTQECFNVANKQFDLLWGKAFKEGYKHINQLVSDLHWFNEKSQKLKTMVQEGGISLTNSNIINKYAALEAAKTNFTDAVEKKFEQSKSWSSLWSALSIVGFFAFSFVMTIFGYQQKKQNRLYEAIENDVEENPVPTAAKVDRILENLFSKLEMPKTYKFMNNFHSNILEQQYAAFESNDQKRSESEKNSIGKTSKRKIDVVTADFQESMNSVLDNLQTKAFTHGIMMQADLDDDFLIKGDQEALSQFLYNLVDFAADNSLHHNSGRRITLKSKALGGTAYLKIGIANYCFNGDELDYLNSQEQENRSSDVNMNLILIKELLADINGSLAVKNKMSSQQKMEGCEIEVIFQRYKEEPKAKDVKVVKGSKKDILSMMQSEA